MKATFLARTAVVILALAFGAMALEGGPQVQTQNGVSYVTGGVSSDEAKAIKAMGNQLNLQITMAAATGAYMGGGTVTIVDNHGHAVLSTESDGPLFYAQLKPGTYTVKVSGSGKEMQQTATISAGGHQAMNFTWSAAADSPDPLRGVPARKGSDELR